MNEITVPVAHIFAVIVFMITFIAFMLDRRDEDEKYKLSLLKLSVLSLIAIGITGCAGIPETPPEAVSAAVTCETPVVKRTGSRIRQRSTHAHDARYAGCWK